jgi:hypothetical protein
VSFFRERPRLEREDHSEDMMDPPPPPNGGSGNILYKGYDLEFFSKNDVFSVGDWVSFHLVADSRDPKKVRAQNVRLELLE